eukprot:TRINITY_DN19148_c0_g1_i1.p1 TRINITY_DN19148_c0_g1~~TRINITY_DN19148_c0_g1_i1.p1  ORF type:complete len:508 (+),score=58.43 TRINITY_DN19148_c0_g1_i1:140-1663(+)
MAGALSSTILAKADGGDHSQTCDVPSAPEPLRLVDLVGGGRRPGFTHMHGFLGPRGYCVLGTASLQFADRSRTRFNANALFVRHAVPMRRLLAAAMRNNIDEVWIRLRGMSTGSLAEQQEKDLALRWTSLFPTRRSMARLLEKHGANRDRATSLDSVATGGAFDYADTVFRAEHAMSVSCAPAAADVSAGLPKEKRATVISWILTACSAVSLDDALTAGTTLTLDRYYATRKSKPVSEGELHLLTLASLCAEMKLTEIELTQPSRQILIRLSQGQVSFDTISRAERRLVRDVDSRADVPTPIRLMRLLLHPLQEVVRILMRDSRLACRNHAKRSVDTVHAFPKWGAVASLLLELAMFDVDLAHGVVPSVLAASALGAALLCIGAHGVADVPVPQAADWQGDDAECTAGLHEAVVACLESWSSGADFCTDEIRSCEERLFVLWMDCAFGLSQWSSNYTALCARHKSRFSRTRIATTPADGGGCCFSEVLRWGVVRFETLYGGSPNGQS